MIGGREMKVHVAVASAAMILVGAAMAKDKTIFQELPPPKSRGTLRFQGFSPPRPVKAARKTL